MPQWLDQIELTSWQLAQLKRLVAAKIHQFKNSYGMADDDPAIKAYEDLLEVLKSEKLYK